MKKSWLLLVGVLFLASCQSNAPLRQFTKGALLASYDFSTPQSFEEGAYGAATLEVVNGTYEIDVMQGDNALWWGQGGESYGDVIIDVDTEQLDERNENAYGVMCRVLGSVGQPEAVDPTLAAMMHDSTEEPSAASTSEATSEATAEATAELSPTALLTPTPEPTRAVISQGDGYLFLIQGSGSFAIMRSRGRNLTPLVDWKTSDAIKQGPAQNHIRAVCVGNYLAMYVNDQFLGDATDGTYTTGQVGLAASAASWLGTRISFDNLTISAATLQ